MEQLDTILIVDDSHLHNAMLNDILAPHYRVMITDNGSKALHIASTQRINMVLLDIMMPGIDGFAVCHSLKNIPALAEIPILFISALSNTSDIVHAFKTGGADYITKPYQAEEVLARIGVHLRLQRSKAEVQSLLSQTMNGVIEIINDLLTSKYPVLVRHVNQMRLTAEKMMQLLSIGRHHPQSTYSSSKITARSIGYHRSGSVHSEHAHYV
ncbi:DNA-binding response OmpR family regulator [Paenibacillus taihuensis]|uniref:DNA-binding response OmpR family regulator n=1 Tax=Paenibacillus taihuensis TaxID=1156355 RepID=A0A3D9RX74_9BACL|nr:response regulator [Paenibacillus taihuensis]REE84427.1 DNA-binding response OmpR family regulator [Paenibacillus taihuensis]